jgi:RNA polymerase sigma-70 factor (ECF subfamily)
LHWTNAAKNSPYLAKEKFSGIYNSLGVQFYMPTKCTNDFALPAHGHEQIVLMRGRAWWSDLLRQIARRTGNQAEAEDLLHSAYLRLESYRTENVVHDPAAFLVRTAFNISIDNYRRSKKFQDDDGDAMVAPDLSPLQDEVLASRARLERVKEGLMQMSPKTREIFLMHRLNNYKYHEIASHLNISESSVEKHIAKAFLFLNKWAKGW